MVIALRRRGALLGALTAMLAGACQAPTGYSQFAYGSAPACRENLAEAPASLEVSLDPLRVAFDAHSEVPRMVVLLPHAGCERGAEILRREVLDAHPNGDLRLFIVWQDLMRNPDPAAALRASRSLDDPRVIAFHDCAGLAGRAFASGNLPVAEAREVFLFYPAGLTWPKLEAQRASRAADPTPRTDSWVHQLGRVAPERFCTPQELPAAIRVTMERLLRGAEERRTHRGDQAQPGADASHAGGVDTAQL